MCAEGASAACNAPDKKRPPLSTGAKLPWFSRVARAFLAAIRPGSRGAGKSLRGWLTAYAVSAPIVDYMPWGDVESGAAKLFSINRMCTVPLRMRAGLALASALGSTTGELPRAT